MDSTKRICLWSSPRNISTALMYSFAQRSDTTVVDEPLYAHYLTSTDARDYHPGADSIIAAQRNKASDVIREVMLSDYDTPIVFFKQMTHHLVDLDWTFLQDMVNVILTREPKDMLLSYTQQVETPTMQDVGYAKQVELLAYLRNLGQLPPVIDSKNILMDPKASLTSLCDRLGVPFDDSMLSWPAGPRAEDGVWAEHWYSGVHQSTGFEPYEPKTAPLPAHLQSLWAECEAMYQKLIHIK